MSGKPFSRLPMPSRWMTLANLATAGAALLLASVLLILFQFVSLRSALIEDLSVQATIISDNSTAALLFGDSRASEETLAALQASPSIEAAGIFTPARVPLAQFRRNGATAVDAPSASLAEHGYRFGFRHLELMRNIDADGRQIGFVVIRANLQQLYARLLGYAGLTLVIAMASLGAAYLLVARMRKLIRNAEAHLAYLAHVDSITGLPNRHAFNEGLVTALRKVDGYGGSVSLLLLDLDNFKIVNDTLGHQSGDRLLKLVAQRLIEGLRSADAISRIGGDEFVIILESAGAAEGESVAAKILAALAAPFAIGVHEIYVTASVGISIYPQDACDSQTLIRNADTAMYQAKEKGRNAFQRFHPEMDLRAQRRLSLESSLRKALERGELSLYYQPQVSMHDCDVIAVEALLRWNHPELGMMQPDEFIPLAEESGLIVPIGRWALHAACRQAAAWRDEGLGTVHIAVNLSARQARDSRLVNDIIGALGDAGLSPGQLELEITETVLMENGHASVELLNRLQAEGVRLAIDDFGTGYSSMAYLKRFPIHQVKIDRTFVRDIPGDGDDEAIVCAIIAMAHSLGMSVVAEGVESEQQLHFLRNAGCDVMQGYYFAKPLAAEEITAILRRRAAGAGARSLSDSTGRSPAPDRLPSASRPLISGADRS